MPLFRYRTFWRIQSGFPLMRVNSNSIGSAEIAQAPSPGSGLEGCICGGMAPKSSSWGRSIEAILNTNLAWARLDSNQRPEDYESPALTN